MNRSGSPGITLKDTVPQFKATGLLTVTDPTLNTWYPILNLSGSGVFYQGRVQTGNVAVQVLSLRVTLDGVVLLTALTPNQAGSVMTWIETVLTMKTINAGELNFTVPFKNSLLVEMKTDTTLPGGAYIGAEAIYGEN